GTTPHARIPRLRNSLSEGSHGQLLPRIGRSKARYAATALPAGATVSSVPSPRAYSSMTLAALGARGPAQAAATMHKVKRPITVPHPPHDWARAAGLRCSAAEPA